MGRRSLDEEGERSYGVECGFLYSKQHTPIMGLYVVRRQDPDLQLHAEPTDGPPKQINSISYDKRRMMHLQWTTTSKELDRLCVRESDDRITVSKAS